MLMQVHLLQTETIHLRTALTKMHAEAMTFQQDIKKLQVRQPCTTPRHSPSIGARFLGNSSTAPQHPPCLVVQVALLPGYCFLSALLAAA